MCDLCGGSSGHDRGGVYVPASRREEEESRAKCQHDRLVRIEKAIAALVAAGKAQPAEKQP